MEGRTEDRRQLIFLLKVMNGEDGTFLGQVSDITPTGVMLVCPDPVEPRKEHVLSIELPREMERVSVLTLTAECKWCKPDEDPRFYSCGFAFETLTPREERIIRALVEQFLYDEPEDEPPFPEEL